MMGRLLCSFVLVAILLAPFGAPDGLAQGERTTIAVSRFEDKSAKGYAEIGQGLADMLTTALVQSGRFDVLERQELGAVLQEQDLAAAGRVKEGTGAPTGEITGAQYLVTGAVTAFEPSAVGGGGGAVLPNLGVNLGGGMKQAYIAIDLRVVDTKTSRIVSSTTVEGRARDFLGGMGLPVGGGKTKTFIGLGGFVNTPMEKAVRVCIQNAVDHIAANVR